jgi:plasmid stabilization system protein ParE
MSGGEIDFVPAARREAEDAIDWYLERSPRAGEVFVRELESGLALIAGAPSVWPRFEAGTRRYVLRKFPYSIIYRETKTGIEVVAISHHKRRPRYWHGR